MVVTNIRRITLPTIAVIIIVLTIYILLFTVTILWRIDFVVSTEILTQTVLQYDTVAEKTQISDFIIVKK